MLLQLTACPDASCRVPAEITDRFALASTDGPIEYVRTYCLHRHVFTVPTARTAGTEIVRP